MRRVRDTGDAMPDRRTAIRRVADFFAGFFRSPHEQAVAMFLRKGFSDAEAIRAANDLWLACRRGRPTPRWIIDRLDASDGR